MKQISTEKKIDLVYEFWTKMCNKDIRNEAVSIFINRITSEYEDSFVISETIVKSYSLNQIQRFCYSNFITYVFVSIFNCNVPFHVIEDTMIVVMNDGKERFDFKEDMAIKLIKKVSDRCKNKK